MGSVVATCMLLESKGHSLETMERWVESLKPAVQVPNQGNSMQFLIYSFAAMQPISGKITTELPAVEPIRP